MIAELAGLLVRAAKADWVLVIEIGDGVTGLSNYNYFADGSWVSSLPRASVDACIAVAKQLRAAVQVPGQAPWVPCLFQVANTGAFAIHSTMTATSGSPTMPTCSAM